MFRHDSVLIRPFETLDLGVVKTYIDLTGGGGGHSAAMLARFPQARLIVIDRDQQAVKHLSDRFSAAENVRVVHGKASEIDKIAFLLQAEAPDFIFADLGVSSPQFDEASRGFSFSKDGPFDMRMDQSAGETALELVKRLSERELVSILSQYGEERESKTVACALKRAAEEGMTTTAQFHNAIVSAKRYRKGIDPATQSFMALRIAVNDEFGELEKMLLKSFNLLKTGGVIGIITFHSLEDRIVMRFFRERKRKVPMEGCGAFDRVELFDPIEPDEEELASNPRSRSARLRMIRKW